MLNRKVKPASSGKIQFSLPEINLFNLENSVKVYHVEKRSLPIVQINLLIPAGSIHSPENKVGVSALTSMLIDEGAGGVNGLEISNRIEMLGSILNITSNKEVTTISLLSLKENFIESLEILSLILLSPTFSQADFEREKQKIESHILQLNDDPSYLASKELNSIIYTNTPYQFPSNGSKDTLGNINNEDIRKFYNDNYKPNGSSLVVVGDISKSELEVHLNNLFGKWKGSNNNKLKTIIIKKTTKQLVLVNKSDAAQSELRVGHISEKRNSDNFFSRTILNSILGGQFSSRINLNLREDKGFTYGANSNYHYNRVGSTFAVSTSVKTENTIEALNEIMFELKNVKKTLREEEISFSKSYLVRRYPSLFETYSQIATNISLLPFYNLEKEYFSNYIKNINEVKLDDVVSAAHDSINLDNLVIIVVGSSKLLKDDLIRFSNSNNFDFIINN